MPRSTPSFNESDEIIYKNYLRLDETEKFRIYYKKDRFNEKNKQDYYGLTFNPDDSISS